MLHNIHVSSHQYTLSVTDQYMTTLSVNDGLLRLCPAVEDFCGDLGWEVACTTSHLVAIIINILHMVMLRKLNNQLSSSLLNILMNTSLADILSSFSMIVKINCAIHHLSAGKPQVLTALLSASTDVGPLFRFYILALAAWERTVAICYPQHYQTHVLVRHSLLCIASMWLFVTAAVFLRDFIFNDTHCLTAILGVANYHAMEPKAIIYILMLIPSLITGILVVILAWKLRSVRRRIITGESCLNLLRSYTDTKYVLIVSVAFYISFLPTLISFLLLFLGIKILVFNWIIVLMFAIYGVGNIAIYAVMSKAYRYQILRTIGVYFTTWALPDSHIAETIF